MNNLLLYILLCITLFIIYILTVRKPITEHIGSLNQNYLKGDVPETNNTCGSTSFECPDRYRNRDKFNNIICNNALCELDTCCEKKVYCDSDKSVCANGLVYKHDFQNLECVGEEGDGIEVNNKFGESIQSNKITCSSKTCCDIPIVQYDEHKNKVPITGTSVEITSNDTIDTGMDEPGQSTHDKLLDKHDCEEKCTLSNDLPGCIGYTFNSDPNLDNSSDGIKAIGSCTLYSNIQSLRHIKSNEESTIYIRKGVDVDMVQPTCKHMICPNPKYGSYIKAPDTKICDADICTIKECCSVPQVTYGKGEDLDGVMVYKNQFPYYGPLEIISNITNITEITGKITSEGACKEMCSLGSNDDTETRCLGYAFDSDSNCNLYREKQ